MTSLSLATLIVDALVDAKFVGKSDLDAAVRRTKATLIYRRTKNLRAVQLLLGHSKLESAPPSQEPR